MEVSEGCSCQVNVLQCTLDGVEIVERLFHLAAVRGKNNSNRIFVGGGYLYGWLHRSCLAMFGLELLVGNDA